MWRTPSPGYRTVLMVAGSVAAALLLAVLAVWLVGQRTSPETEPDAVTYPVRGIDISHHQGEIDWARLARQKIRFAYLKSSEGGDWVDPSFADNLEKARTTGIALGAYHFFTLCTPGPLQARNFMRVVPAGPHLTLPPAIDLEYVGNCTARPGKAKLARELKAFIAIVTRHYRKTPVLYSTQTFFQDYLVDEPAFAAYPLWVRNLHGESAWARDRPVMFRQFASHARFDGIDGPVDLNVFAGTEKQFAELLETGRLPP